ncbi:restriction endonuclease subunit S [Sulfurimonas sp.]|uniref:restriction endonuclease subunit S n=1 Tax=Sulfurimonas sp. TaxID=2022749 RepID=UPI0025DFC891|nr:restriction endonuclease subunit S [Sulfurimonas sp.]
MSEWKEYKISEIAYVIGGGTPKTEIEEYWNGNIPWLAPRDLTGYSNVYISHGDRFITEMGLKNSSTKLMPKGSVLLTSRAPIGYVAIAQNEICTNQGFKSLVPKNGICISEFLYYWIKNSVDYLQQLGSGTTFAEISGSVVKDIDILLPQLEEQKAIAEVLSSLDDKIDLLHRQNKTLEELAQTLFRQWFIEEAKDEWEEVALGEVVETTSGGTPSRSKMEFYEDGTIEWIKSKELSGGFILSTEEKITAQALKNSSAKLLPKHSVLIAMYGATVGEYAIISKEMTCNQAICALKPNEKYPYTFLFMFVKNYKEEIINMAVGSAQQNISQQLIKTLPIPTCFELIDNFHKQTDSLFEKILSNIKQIQTLENMRDTLLPKLMSGEVRVKL